MSDSDSTVPNSDRPSIIPALLIVASLVVALALGAVGLYAHERQVTAASAHCPAGFDLIAAGSSDDPCVRYGLPSPGALTVIPGSGRVVRAVDRLNVVRTSQIEVPARGLSGLLGRDAAIWWWYAGAAVLALGIGVGALLSRPRRSPEAQR